MVPFEISAIIIGVIVLVVGIVASLLAVFDGSANKVTADAAQTAVEAAKIAVGAAQVADTAATSAVGAAMVTEDKNFGKRPPIRKSSKKRRRNSLF
jgi:hypothetical protein